MRELEDMEQSAWGKGSQWDTCDTAVDGEGLHKFLLCGGLASKSRLGIQRWTDFAKSHLPIFSHCCEDIISPPASFSIFE